MFFFSWLEVYTPGPRVGSRVDPAKTAGSTPVHTPPVILLMELRYWHIEKVVPEKRAVVYRGTSPAADSGTSCIHMKSVSLHSSTDCPLSCQARLWVWVGPRDCGRLGKERKSGGSVASSAWSGVDQEPAVLGDAGTQDWAMCQQVPESLPSGPLRREISSN